MKKNDITPDEFKSQLHADIEAYEKDAKNDLSEAKPYIKKIEKLIIESTEKPIAKVWDDVKRLNDEMPGFFSVWSNTRSLTLRIKATLNKFSRDQLIEAEYEIYKNNLLENEQSMHDKNEKLIVKERKILSLKKQISELESINPDHAELKNIRSDCEVLNKRYQEKLTELITLKKEKKELEHICLVQKENLKQLKNEYEDLEQVYGNAVEKITAENMEIKKELYQLENGFASDSFTTEEKSEDYVKQPVDTKSNEQKEEKISQEVNSQQNEGENKSALDLVDIAELLRNPLNKNMLSENKVKQLVQTFKGLCQLSYCNKKERELHQVLKSEYQENWVWLEKFLEKNPSVEKIHLAISKDYTNHRLLCALSWIKYMDIPEHVNKVKNLLDETFKQEFGVVGGQEIKTRRINEVLNRTQWFYKTMKSNEYFDKLIKHAEAYVRCAINSLFILYSKSEYAEQFDFAIYKKIQNTDMKEMVTNWLGNSLEYLTDLHTALLPNQTEMNKYLNCFLDENGTPKTELLQFFDLDENKSENLSGIHRVMQRQDLIKGFITQLGYLYDFGTLLLVFRKTYRLCGWHGDYNRYVELCQETSKLLPVYTKLIQHTQQGFVSIYKECWSLYKKQAVECSQPLWDTHFLIFQKMFSDMDEELNNCKESLMRLLKGMETAPKIDYQNTAKEVEEFRNFICTIQSRIGGKSTEKTFISPETIGMSQQQSNSSPNSISQPLTPTSNLRLQDSTLKTSLRALLDRTQRNIETIERTKSEIDNDNEGEEISTEENMQYDIKGSSHLWAKSTSMEST
jgi:hypothetical protein